MAGIKVIVTGAIVWLAKAFYAVVGVSKTDSFFFQVYYQQPDHIIYPGS